MSHNIWFISDTHFGHANILEYEKEARPFSSLEEMHEVMIERWNSVVQPKDILYHLGDFAFGRRGLSVASRLNGKKSWSWEIMIPSLLMSICLILISFVV